MIAAGLRVVPWLRPSKRAPQGILDCTSCMSGTSTETRARMHCGWMPSTEWVPGREGMLLVGSPPWTEDVCPGWAVRQPAVIDGVEAARALEVGELSAFDPDIHGVTWEAASISLGAVNQHSVQSTEENR